MRTAMRLILPTIMLAAMGCASPALAQKVIPPYPPGGDPNEDTLDLLSIALYLRENHTVEIVSAGVASKSDGDYRARASARPWASRTRPASASSKAMGPA